MKKNKFYKAPTNKERIANIKYSFLFWKGRKKGVIHTRNIKLDDLRYIFFPKDFSERYGYLGSVPSESSKDIFKAIFPLVLAMDYETRPWWCPQWFLRFLEVFGNDRSIVRVRNFTLHRLHTKLTKGYRFYDYKTKWCDYDLRIHVVAPEHLHNLGDDIESGYWDRGKQKELVEAITKLDPNAGIIWGSVERLKKQLEKLENQENE
jgi:hypothetical protein